MLIILILFILYSTFFLLKKEPFNIINTVRLKIFNLKQRNYDLVIIMSFIIIYITILRIIKLFLSVKIINLNLLIIKVINVINFILSKYNLIFILIILILIINFVVLLRKFLIYYLKISFIRLNYYYSQKYESFFLFYINVISWQSFLWYWVTVEKLKLNERNQGIFFVSKNKIYLNFIFFFFKVIGYLIILIMFFIDICFHQNNLIFTCNILPFFAFYQTLYRINYYLNNTLRAKYDNFCINYIYLNDKFNFTLIIEISKYLEKIIKK